jgi:Amino-transferase class IV
MLTFLWQKGTKPSQILLHGHACWSGKPDQLDDYNPEPISTILVISSNHEQMPNHYSSNPESKVSAWCHQQWPLEEAFRVMGEILLTRPVGDDIHILEGLTSNIFFIYPNNKLLTASDGVLKGYAQKLVLDCAKACGLQYDLAPIRVQDAQIWHKVFLTSSF